MDGIGALGQTALREARHEHRLKEVVTARDGDSERAPVPLHLDRVDDYFVVRRLLGRDGLLLPNLQLEDLVRRPEQLADLAEGLVAQANVVDEQNGVASLQHAVSVGYAPLFDVAYKWVVLSFPVSWI